MELVLQRLTLTEKSTIGELRGGGLVWDTLELPVRDGLPGSAIPPGLYLISLLPSPKFESSTDPWVQQYAAEIPHVLGIPNRSNILIHWGNTVADTEGCILVGDTEAADYIGESRKAFAALWLLLKAARDAGEVISLAVQGGIPTTGSNRDDVQEAAAGQ
jgi:Steigviridae/Suoliviridae L,D-carboxypeptidase/transpeptidase